MSIQLYSEEGYVDDIGSNGGYAHLLLFLKSIPGAGKLKEFLKEGRTEDIKEVREDLAYVLDRPETKTNVAVSSVLIHLRDGMKSVKEVGIIQ